MIAQIADIVVTGAGHNSLITAAYLVKAGYRVLVLDARPVPGGGAVTEELMLPGFRVDTCSTGHTLIRSNPVITDDELGLFADHALEYVDPDPVAHIRFPDGEYFTMWLDAERTTAEIERFSRPDAVGYGRLLAEYSDVGPLFARSRHLPVGAQPTLEESLDSHPKDRIWQRRLAISAWDIIKTEFENRHVRALMFWMASQTGMDIGLPGTGDLAYSVISGRQRCVGVEDTSGERYLARKAVVSTIHIKHLIEMAPAECWPEEFHYGVKTYNVGIPMHGVYLLTTAPPVFETTDGTCSAVSAGYAGWPEDMLEHFWRIRNGQWTNQTGWLLIATPTLADPGRAPAGQHTIKILSPQAYQPPAGVSAEEARDRYADHQLAFVQRLAPNLSDETILARMNKGPHDYERQNPHMIQGAFHGGDRGIAQIGPNRPVPGWAQHRMPIAGLYQTGGTTHPGGSITGIPGRNAARVLLADLGCDPDQVLAPM